VGTKRAVNDARKPRGVRFSDEEWADVTALALADDREPSAVLRWLVEREKKRRATATKR
jgi:hypothetical protein